MSKKKTAKAKATRGIRNISAKTLSAKQARDVKGGAVDNLMQACATGTHYKEGTIVVR